MKLNPPRRYADVLLTDLQPSQSVTACLTYAGQWGQYRKSSTNPDAVGKGLRIATPDRTGLAAATYNYIKKKHYPFSAWITMQQFVELHQQRMDNNKDTADFEDAYNALQYIQHRAELLVIDGLGSERATASDFFIEQFYSLVNSRYDRGYPTIITQVAATSRYPEYIASLLRDAFWLIAPGKIVAPGSTSQEVRNG